MLQDLNFAARLLARSPGYAIVAVTSLAIGIGASTAMFSVLHAVVRPLPFPEPARLVELHEYAQASPETLDKTSPGGFADWTARAQAFSGIAAYVDSYVTGFNLTGPAIPQRVSSIFVTGGFFSVLGVTPMLGAEMPASAIGQEGSNNIVLLSHRFWVTHFGADRTIVGRTVALNDGPYVIAGVMPEAFHFIRDVDLWRQGNPVPSLLRQARSSRWWSVIARIRPGVTMEAARADMDRVGAALAGEHREQAGRGIRVTPLDASLMAGIRRPVAVLFGAVCLVLLIACANVAGLVLARFSARGTEFTLRLALGATRRRLARQMFAESLLLALPSAGAGLILAAWFTSGILALAPERLTRLPGIGVNPAVVAFTAGVAVLITIAIGLAPLVQSRRLAAPSMLRGGRTVTATGTRSRAMLIAGQIAVATVLLAGAGLLVRSYARLTSVEPGFDRSNVATIDVALHAQRYQQEWRQVVTFYRDAMARVASIPGVRSAAATSLVPFGEGAYQETIRNADTGTSLTPEYRFVSPGFFSTLGIPLLRGRDFSAADMDGAAPVAIVSASAARQLFGDADPIGKRITFRRNRQRTIVAVAADTRLFSLDQLPQPQIYAPYEQAGDVYWTGLTFLLRGDGDPAALASLARTRLLEADPAMPPFNLRTIDALVSRSTAPARLYSTLLASFAVVAVALACIGLYGLMATVVNARTREMSVRVALGASPRQIGRLIIRQAAALTACGLIAGIAAAAAGVRLLERLLFGITATDVPTFAMTIVALCAASMLAAALPAWRATRVDPALALRSE